MSPNDPPTVPIRRAAARRSTRWLCLVVGVLVGVLVLGILVVLRSGDSPMVAAGPGVVLEPVAASHGSAPRRAPTAAEVADGLFVADVDAQGVSYAGRDDVVAAGRNVCAFLGRGGTTAGARLLAVGYRRYSPADAATIVRAAVRAYCPDRVAAAR